MSNKPTTKIAIVQNGVVTAPYHPRLWFKLRGDKRFKYKGKGVWQPNDKFIAKSTEAPLPQAAIDAWRDAMLDQLTMIVAEFWELEFVSDAAAPTEL